MMTQPTPSGAAPAPCEPLTVAVEWKAVNLRYCDLAGELGPALIGVRLVATTTTSAELSGKSYPTLRRLFVGKPVEFRMVPGDTLRLSASKEGTVEVRMLVKADEA